MKYIRFISAMLLLPAMLFANEGMWLPMLIKKLNMGDMKEAGLELSAEDIYSINQSSLKDAIVSLGGFCTGEIISPNGLMLTNHHCGYGQIQNHSTVENDYLSEGFWAMSYEEEKPNPGLFVRFLVRMEDVTERVTAELNEDMNASERNAAARKVYSDIIKEATEDTHYEAEVKPFLHGNEYYLMVYERFTDVRLVGAPPSSIGKFGGDTDNWMWPRHTGDFTLFRVYSGPDGKPAAYSEDNIPLKPRHHLPVSLDGVSEGDFTMVFGFPGSTDRYRTSYGIQQALDKTNQAVVDVRDVKLAIMREFMDADDEVRINFASKYASTANYWKYFQGQSEQLRRNRVANKKKKLEDAYRDWVKTLPADEQAHYGQALDLIREYYETSDKYAVTEIYAREAGLSGAEIFIFALRSGFALDRYFQTESDYDSKIKLEKDKQAKQALVQEKEEKLNMLRDNLRNAAGNHFETYYPEIDQRLAAELLALYHRNLPSDVHPEFFATIVEKKFKGDFSDFADKLFGKSIFASEDAFNKFLDKPKQKSLGKDLGYIAAKDLYATYQYGENNHPEASDKKARGYRIFTAGLRQMQPDRKFYPDANSTLRLTWGSVGSYFPRDGAFYNYKTTHRGILQKENPNDREFVVPQRLLDLINAKDFGQYADENGDLVINFISNNDITGGNSGSPVINGKGHLIGCAFDGNWEAMSGDIFFEDEIQRTISVDTRYILFIIDKYAGARNLIDEMTIVKTEGESASK